MIIKFLRSHGLDVISVQEVNREGLSDEIQLLSALAENRVIYTANIKDFYQLQTLFLTTGKSHTGIILVKQQSYSIGAIIRAILRLISAKSAEEMVNQV